MALMPLRTIPLTQEAYDKYMAEIKRLLIEKKALQGRVNVAREMGDLSENGAYKYAKIELGNVSKQLRDLHLLIDSSIITSPQTTTNKVGFGSKVTISDGKSTETYTLVTMYESDLAAHKLSQESPIGAALMNKKKGDTVKITTPGGTISYTIITIE